MRGGRGQAGRLAHKRTKVVAEGIEMGKHGFVSHRRRVARAINLRDLAPLIAESSEKGSKEALPVVDLTGLGYAKLLGQGNLSRPVEVKVASASKAAMKKIEAAGGKVILPK